MHVGMCYVPCIIHWHTLSVSRHVEIHRDTLGYIVFIHVVVRAMYPDLSLSERYPMSICGTVAGIHRHALSVLRHAGIHQDTSRYIVSIELQIFARARAMLAF
jgi:hypothetical protein